jgi:hypothetical protein
MLSADYKGKILVLKMVGEFKKEHVAESDQLLDDKIAVVGSLDWQKLATLLVSPFTRAMERFFEPDEMQEALDWLRG